MHTVQIELPFRNAVPVCLLEDLVLHIQRRRLHEWQDAKRLPAPHDLLDALDHLLVVNDEHFAGLAEATRSMPLPIVEGPDEHALVSSRHLQKPVECRWIHGHLSPLEYFRRSCVVVDLNERCSFAPVTILYLALAVDDFVTVVRPCLNLHI